MKKETRKRLFFIAIKYYQFAEKIYFLGGVVFHRELFAQRVALAAVRDEMAAAEDDGALNNNYAGETVPLTATTSHSTFAMES